MYLSWRPFAKFLMSVGPASSGGREHTVAIHCSVSQMSHCRSLSAPKLQRRYALHPITAAYRISSSLSQSVFRETLRRLDDFCSGYRGMGWE